MLLQVRFPAKIRRIRPIFIITTENFNPRFPHGERPQGAGNKTVPKGISTHVPRTARKSIFKLRKMCYTVRMDITTLIDFFEKVETTEEYNGYFCSIAEASELWCWAACAG